MSPSFLLTSGGGAATSVLPVLASAASTVLRGSADAMVSSAPDGSRWFTFGTVDGRRLASGALQRVAAPDIPDAIDEGTLEGPFVAIRLATDGTVVIHLDPFAMRDVFFGAAGGAAFAASEVTLVPHQHRDSIDQLALAHALTVYGTRPPKRHSLWSGISRLGPGQVATIGSGKVSVTSRPFEAPASVPHSELRLDDYADALLEAVRARASSNSNVVYLSSGWDSTALLACLVHLFGPSKVRAVIGRMVYAERSGVINQFEIDRARAMAEYFGVSLSMVDLNYTKDADGLLAGLLPALAPRQFTSLTGLNHAILARFTAQTADVPAVVFAGEISDGAHNLGFSQYATYFHPTIEFREMFDKMAGYLFSPSFLRLVERGVHTDDPIYALFRQRSGAAMFDEAAADPVVRRRQMLSSLFLRGSRVPFWSIRNVSLLSENGRLRYAREIEEPYLQEAAEALTPETAYSWYLHLYNSFHWQGATVATLPATAEAFGLQCALPFHDGRVQRFLSTMPEDAGRALDLHPTKYPLKWMLQHRVKYPMHLQVGPHSYLYDVDPTFSHSAEILYGSSLGQVIRRSLQRGRHRDVMSAEVFDLAYIDAVIDRFVSGVEVRGAEMTDLMALGLLSLIDFGEAEAQPA